MEVLDSFIYGNPPKVISSGELFYERNGGHPGGDIGSFDTDDKTEEHFVAPAKFLGNMSAYYGGVLSFDLWDSLDPVVGGPNQVELIGNGHTLFYDYFDSHTNYSPAITWTNWSIPLAPSAWWRLDDYSTTNNIPTAADFLAVLSNLQELNIEGDVSSGDDSCYLDNVRMSAPIPAQIQSPLLVHTNFTFSFSTVKSQSYTVQQNTDLATTNWIFYTNFIGNGSLYQFQAAVSSDRQSFFRVRAP